MTAVFRWYQLGHDRYVVTSGAGTGVLMGYAGKDAARKAKAKAEALATWSRFLGHRAVVMDYQRHEAEYDRGAVWSTLMAHD